MSNLGITDLLESKELNHKAMADVKGGTFKGIDAIRNLAAEKASQASESDKSSSSYPQDQEPELGVTPNLGIIPILGL